MEKTALVWFRNDLRIRDNVVLHNAIENSGKILPVFCFDPRLFSEIDLGFKKTGPLRTKFLIESVEDLRKNIRQLGGELIIRIGEPEEVIAELASQTNVDRVYASKEVTREETDIENKLEEKLYASGIPLELEWQSTLFHEDDIPWPIGRLPDVFTKFRKENEKATPIRNEVPSPTQINCVSVDDPGKMPDLKALGHENIPGMDNRAAITFEGGESAAWKRIQEYFWDGDHLKNYKFTRNGLIGKDYSSKLSPWLSLGCISPRAIRNEVKSYEEKVKKNVSTYWLIFELIWRDYFRFVCKKYGDKVFYKGGIKDESPDYKNYWPSFEKWMQGTTGVPFIDANMRELRYTGYMSNRGRQNVVSFLVKDLSIDWRWGAAWFESMLVDYDVCSNWGNWMYNAGVGNDPRDRYFNIISQAQKYDSKGEYVRRWVPELTDIPGFKAHHPSEIQKSELSGYGIELGVDYPEPLVTFERWMVN